MSRKSNTENNDKSMTSKTNAIEEKKSSKALRGNKILIK